MIRNAGTPGECVTDDALTDYLDGGLDPIVKAASEVHLIACDRCRRRLAFFMRLLKEEVNPQEEIAIVAAQKEWDRTAKHRAPRVPRGVSHRQWMLALAGLVAVLVLAFGLRETMNRIGEPHSAGEVVQLLMEQHRPFEGRISGQPELPFVSTRGPEDTDTNFDLLTGQMTRLGATPAEMGRFYLLERNFGRAIEYLRQAAQEQGATAEVQNDLGVAYLESGGADGLRGAVTQFNKALAVKGDFAPAVFNLALAYERLGDVLQEREALTRFLQIETDKAWTDEARAKLEGIRAE